MKKVLLNAYRCIVGNEFGWTGEGNEQWYYSLALVINLMLTWWIKPELGIIFTVAAVIHYATVCVYGAAMLFDYSVWYSIAYYAIHTVIFIVCFFFNWKWTMFTSLIVIVAYFVAPNCTGDNIFTSAFCGNRKIAAIFLFHTIIFAAFVVVALSLPISLWMRILIIVICMILHPFIDFIEGECMIISDATVESFGRIVETIKENTK